jgi:hypothetical protein
MTDQQIGHIIEYLAKDAVGLAFLGFVAKWMLTKWLENGKEIRRLEIKQALEMAKESKELIGQVKDTQILLRAEFSSLKERLDLITPIMNRSTERFVKITTAFEGFVETNNKRIERLEHATAEVLKIGKDLRLVTTKKPPQGGNGG